MATFEQRSARMFLHSLHPQMPKYLPMPPCEVGAETAIGNHRNDLPLGILLSGATLHSKQPVPEESGNIGSMASARADIMCSSRTRARKLISRGALEAEFARVAAFSHEFLQVKSLTSSDYLSGPQHPRVTEFAEVRQADDEGVESLSVDERYEAMPWPAPIGYAVRENKPLCGSPADPYRLIRAVHTAIQVRSLPPPQRQNNARSHQ